MANNINELRTHLFDALKGLKDGTLDIERAKAMSEMAQVVVNSAKVEVDYAKATGSKNSPFLEMQQIQEQEKPSVPTVPSNAVRRYVDGKQVA